MIKESYVKEVNQGDMVGLGHQGPVPPHRREDPRGHRGQAEEGQDHVGGRADPPARPRLARSWASARTWTSTRTSTSPCSACWPTSIPTPPTSIRTRRTSSSSDVQGKFTGIGIQIRKDNSQRHAAGGDADQGQPGVQGRHPGRRRHHQDHARRGQQGQCRCATRGDLHQGPGAQRRRQEDPGQGQAPRSS